MLCTLLRNCSLTSSLFCCQERFVWHKVGRHPSVSLIRFVYYVAWTYLCRLLLNLTAVQRKNPLRFYLVVSHEAPGKEETRERFLECNWWFVKWSRHNTGQYLDLPAVLNRPNNNPLSSPPPDVVQLEEMYIETAASPSLLSMHRKGLCDVIPTNIMNGFIPYTHVSCMLLCRLVVATWTFTSGRRDIFPTNQCHRPSRACVCVRASSCKRGKLA